MFSAVIWLGKTIIAPLEIAFLHHPNTSIWGQVRELFARRRNQGLGKFQVVTYPKSH